MPWGVLVEVAVLGRIDGDLHALEAVLAHARDLGIYRFLHLGDVLGSDARAALEVLDRLDAAGIPGVRGAQEDDPALAARLGEAVAARVAGWPLERRLVIGGVSAHLFHGTPASREKSIHPDTRQHFLSKLGRRSGADILVYTGTLTPYLREVDRRLFLSVGSVARVSGLPSFGILTFGLDRPRARFVSLPHLVRQVT